MAEIEHEGVVKVMLEDGREIAVHHFQLVTYSRPRPLALDTPNDTFQEALENVRRKIMESLGSEDPYATGPLPPPSPRKTAYAWIEEKVSPITDGTYTIWITGLGTLDIVNANGYREYLASDIKDMEAYTRNLDSDAFFTKVQRTFRPEETIWRQGEP